MWYDERPQYNQYRKYSVTRSNLTFLWPQVRYIGSLSMHQHKDQRHWQRPTQSVQTRDSLNNTKIAKLVLWTNLSAWLVYTCGNRRFKTLFLRIWAIHPNDVKCINGEHSSVLVSSYCHWMNLCITYNDHLNLLEKQAVCKFLKEREQCKADHHQSLLPP